MKRGLQKTRRNRGLVFGLALAMLVPMIPGNEAQAASGTKPVVDLGNATLEDRKVTFKEVTVTGEGIEAVVVTIEPAEQVDYDADEVLYGVDIDWPDDNQPTMTDKKDSNEDNMTAVWVYEGDAAGWGATDVVDLIESLSFDYAEGMTIHVTVDANATDGKYKENSAVISTNIHAANGHYYMYVPYDPSEVDYDLSREMPDNYQSADSGYSNPTWIQAYNFAKEYKFMGMSGYLATITSGETQENGELGEASFLYAINDKAGWCGGTALVNNNGDSEKINDVAQIPANSLKLYHDDDNADYNENELKRNDPVHNRKIFYWACGPEAGQIIDADNAKGLWAEREGATPEPNHDDLRETSVDRLLSNAMFDDEPDSYLETCVIANYLNQPGLNDIIEGNYNDNNLNNPGARSFGYFVEFGGYADEVGLNNQRGVDKKESIKATVTVTNGDTDKDADKDGDELPTRSEPIWTDEEYIMNVVPGEGYVLPDEITVTVINEAGEEETLEADKDYTWDAETGKVTVKAEAVTGDLNIEVECKEKYDVTDEVRYGDIITQTSDGDESAFTDDNTTDDAKKDEKVATPNKVYTATIDAWDGYNLPDSIRVIVGGDPLNPASNVNAPVVGEYVWDKEKSIVTIPGVSVTDDIIIQADCEAIYDVTENVQNADFEFPFMDDTENDTVIIDKKAAPEKKEYTVVAVPDEGYALTGDFEITIAGDDESLERAEGDTPVTGEYSWNPDTNEITIAAGSVTGDIVISGEAVEIFDITDDMDGADITVQMSEGKTLANHTDEDADPDIDKDKDVVVSGDDYVATIVAEDGYKLTDDIKVTQGGQELANGVDYTWNFETGVLNIPDVTGDIVVSDATVKAHDVTDEVENGNIIRHEIDGKEILFDDTNKSDVPITDVDVADDQKDYKAVIEASGGYELPDTITVTVGGDTYIQSTDETPAGNEYTWTIGADGNGTVFIPGVGVTGDIVISAKGEGIYKVTEDTPYADFDGATSIVPNVQYTATVTPSTGYRLLPETTVTVKDANGNEQLLVAGTDYTWVIAANGVGTITVMDAKVTGDIHIITKAVKDFTAKGEVDDGTFDGASEVSRGERYEATITPDKGYELPDDITVTVGGTTLGKDEYTWDSKTGKVVIEGVEVDGDIVIIADCDRDNDDKDDDDDDDDDNDSPVVNASTTNNTTTPTAQTTGTSSMPKTGDSMNILLYVLLLLGAAGGLAGCIVLKKKSNKDK